MNNVEGSNLYFKTFNEQFSKSLSMMFEKKNIIIALGFVAIKYIFIFVGAMIGGFIGVIAYSSGSISAIIILSILGILAMVFLVLLGMLYNVCIITLTNDKEINGNGFRKNIRKNLNLYISIFIKQIKYYLLPVSILILGYIFMALSLLNGLFSILSIILIVTGLTYTILTSLKLTFSFYIGIRENLEANESIETSLKITEGKKGSIFGDIFIYGIIGFCFLFIIGMILGIIGIGNSYITSILTEIISQIYLGALSIYIYFIYLKYLKQYKDSKGESGNLITIEPKIEKNITETQKDF